MAFEKKGNCHGVGDSCLASSMTSYWMEASLPSPSHSPERSDSNPSLVPQKGMEVHSSLGLRYCMFDSVFEGGRWYLLVVFAFFDFWFNSTNLFKKKRLLLFTTNGYSFSLFCFGGLFLLMLAFWACSSENIFDSSVPPFPKRIFCFGLSLSWCPFLYKNCVLLFCPCPVLFFPKGLFCWLSLLPILSIYDLFFNGFVVLLNRLSSHNSSSFPV